VRQTGAPGTGSLSLRFLERFRIPFARGFTWVLGICLLFLGAQIVLRSHSIKYPGAMIVVGMVVSFFMSLRDKYTFTIFAVGFTLPFFVEFIFVQRDTQVLAVTGSCLIILVLAVLGFGTSVFNRQRLLGCRAISMTFALFLCAGLASMVNTSDRLLSLIALEREAETWLVFVVMINALKEVKHVMTFMSGLFVGFGIECVIFVIQNILGFSFDILGNTRVEGRTDVEAGRIGFQRGTFGASPHTAAEYFVVLTLLMVGVYLCSRRLPVRLNPLLGVIAGGACVVLAAKRAPLGGFAIGLMLIWGLVAKRAPGALRRLAPLLAAMAIPVLVLLPLLWLRTHQDYEGAYEERMNLTRVAWDMYHAHPVVGVGAGTYDTIKREYLPDDWKGWLYTVHNRYLLVTAETGTLGIATLLLLYANVLSMAVRGISKIDRNYRPLQIALVGIFAAFYWEMLWHMFDSKQQGYLFWFMAALAFVLPRVLPEGQVNANATAIEART